MSQWSRQELSAAHVGGPSKMGASVVIGGVDGIDMTLRDAVKSSLTEKRHHCFGLGFD